MPSNKSSFWARRKKQDKPLGAVGGYETPLFNPHDWTWSSVNGAVTPRAADVYTDLYKTPQPITLEHKSFVMQGSQKSLLDECIERIAKGESRLVYAAELGQSHKVYGENFTNEAQYYLTLEKVAVMMIKDQGRISKEDLFEKLSGHEKKHGRKFTQRNFNQMIKHLSQSKGYVDDNKIGNILEQCEVGKRCQLKLLAKQHDMPQELLRSLLNPHIELKRASAHDVYGLNEETKNHFSAVLDSVRTHTEMRILTLINDGMTDGTEIIAELGKSPFSESPANVQAYMASLVRAGHLSHNIYIEKLQVPIPVVPLKLTVAGDMYATELEAQDHSQAAGFSKPLQRVKSRQNYFRARSTISSGLGSDLGSPLRMIAEEESKNSFKPILSRLDSALPESEDEDSLESWLPEHLPPNNDFAERLEGSNLLEEELFEDETTEGKNTIKIVMTTDFMHTVADCCKDLLKDVAAGYAVTAPTHWFGPIFAGILDLRDSVFGPLGTAAVNYSDEAQNSRQKKYTDKELRQMVHKRSSIKTAIRFMTEVSPTMQQNESLHIYDTKSSVVNLEETLLNIMMHYLSHGEFPKDGELPEEDVVNRFLAQHEKATQPSLKRTLSKKLSTASLSALGISK